MVHTPQQLIMELQTQAAVAEVLVKALEQAAQAVAVSSSSAIQTHSEPQQALQVHQRLLWLEALGSTNSQPMVLLLFKVSNGHQTIS
jgi:uncharacterized protein YcfL